MRILWFTNTPSLYKKNNLGYNGGGWIESLEKMLSRQEKIELGICFFHSDECFKSKQDNTTYYPISLYTSKLMKIKHNLFYQNFDIIEVKTYINVIEDFKPDIIQIFGSEQSFGLICKYIKIPILIHMQGILNPYLNAWFSPGNNKNDYLNYLGLFNGFLRLITLKRFTQNASREISILQNCKYFLGRTEWDKDITRLYAPDSTYFYCSEILRDAFYVALPWKKNNSKKFQIITIISKVEYKGYDLILKTAKLLKEYTDIDFEWKVFGIKEFDFWEKKLRIKAKNCSIFLMGIASPDELINAMQRADLLVHPSYIDNSPNSVCEAQLLGMPIIATNVGGLSSIIKHGKTGILVPSNDPFMMASKIIEIRSNEKLSIFLGDNARKIAAQRHDVDAIVKQNISAYKAILSDNN